MPSALPSKKRPATIQVVRLKATHEYELEDSKDWGILYDTVLEIKAKDGRAIYWPLDSVTLWIVK